MAETSRTRRVLSALWGVVKYTFDWNYTGVGNDFFYVWWLFEGESEIRAYDTLVEDPHAYPTSRGDYIPNYTRLETMDTAKVLAGHMRTGRVTGRCLGMGIIGKEDDITSIVPVTEIENVKRNDAIIALGVAQRRTFQGVFGNVDPEALLWRWVSMRYAPKVKRAMRKDVPREKQRPAKPEGTAEPLPDDTPEKKRFREEERKNPPPEEPDEPPVVPPRTPSPSTQQAPGTTTPSAETGVWTFQVLMPGPGVNEHDLAGFIDTDEPVEFDGQFGYSSLARDSAHGRLVINSIFPSHVGGLCVLRARYPWKIIAYALGEHGDPVATPTGEVRARIERTDAVGRIYVIHETSKEDVEEAVTQAEAAAKDEEKLTEKVKDVIEAEVKSGESPEASAIWDDPAVKEHVKACLEEIRAVRDRLLKTSPFFKIGRDPLAARRRDELQMRTDSKMKIIERFIAGDSAITVENANTAILALHGLVIKFDQEAEEYEATQIAHRAGSSPKARRKFDDAIADIRKRRDRLREKLGKVLDVAEARWKGFKDSLRRAQQEATEDEEAIAPPHAEVVDAELVPDTHARDDMKNVTSPAALPVHEQKLLGPGTGGAHGLVPVVADGIIENPSPQDLKAAMERILITKEHRLTLDKRAKEYFNDVMRIKRELPNGMTNPELTVRSQPYLIASMLLAIANEAKEALRKRQPLDLRETKERLRRSGDFVGETVAWGDVQERAFAEAVARFSQHIKSVPLTMFQGD